MLHLECLVKIPLILTLEVSIMYSQILWFCRDQLQLDQDVLIAGSGTLFIDIQVICQTSPFIITPSPIIWNWRVKRMFHKNVSYKLTYDFKTQNRSTVNECTIAWLQKADSLIKLYQFKELHLLCLFNLLSLEVMKLSKAPL